MALNGYDISNNNGDINNGVVPGDFVIIKATEGVGYTDPNCDANYQQAKAAGKLLGVYHYARPDGNDPISEANWFVSQVQGYIGEAVLALDFETMPFDPAWAKQWLDRVYELTGVRPLLYSYQNILDSEDWSAVWPDYGLWLAEYGMNAPVNGYNLPNLVPTVNGDWTIAMWQYSSQTTLPGWNGYLDADLFYGDVAAWKKYAAKYVEPTPVVPVEPPKPVEQPVTPEPTPAPVTEPTPVAEPPVQPNKVVNKGNIVQEIVSQLESNKTILVNVVVTFFQTAFAAWAMTNFAVDKLALTGAIGAGVSAVWNIVIKPSLKALAK